MIQIFSKKMQHSIYLKGQFFQEVFFFSNCRNQIMREKQKP